MPNVKDLLRKMLLKRTPEAVPSNTVKELDTMTPTDVDMVRDFGATMSDLSRMISLQTHVNFDRFNFYKEVERAILHPLVGAAVELYADVSTTYSQLQGATVWVTSENRKYENELNSMLNRIGIEERVFDWAWNTSCYGDLFLRANGEPGLGITSVSDADHPINISRLDYNGRLIGFFRTPIGLAYSERTLLPPWQYVHCRILGVKKKRPLHYDPNYTEFATVHIMAPDIRRITSRYGTSVLNNALPTYKRMRLAEDALLMARLSKGVLRYIYKVKVDGSNYEGISEIIDEYKTLLKRARAINTDPNSPNFEDRYYALDVNEDVIIPVWGDVNDLQIEELGGKTDIRWIADVEELRNQLASSLRVPLQLLGGYPGEMPSGLGRSAIERYDIRFARQARRVQRALIDSVTRLCQIHLAYMGMDPNVDLFKVQMPETSTAEEEELKDSLDKGTDVVTKLVSMIVDTLGEESIDRIALIDYLNKKILKLDDFDIRSFLKSTTANTAEAKAIQDSIKEAAKAKLEQRDVYQKHPNTDFLAHLPEKAKLKQADAVNEGKGAKTAPALNEDWQKRYSQVKILSGKRAESKLRKKEQEEMNQ